jgi:translation initiation factor 5B
MGVEKDKERIRQPIVTVLGHVDHGKTLLLDSIRGTRVQAGEPGGISQHTGASFIPIDTIRKIAGPLLEKMKVKINIPGLLFIDTPGHEAFVTLRKRGGSVADLAILVVDSTTGFKPQTDESLQFLKDFKTPFIVAATMIDRTPGWFPHRDASFLDTFKEQRDDVREELDRKIYNLMGQLAERGYNSERFDRIEDFTKQIAIVPCSGMTGEGVPELLMMLAGLAQTFLKDRLHVSDRGKGVILEVKDVRGFGITIDVILYDGTVRKGDFLVVGGKEPIVTKIKALLRPKPLKELRTEKQFDSVSDVHAAAGIKIAAPELDSVLSGSPILIVRKEIDVPAAVAEVQKDVQQVEFTSAVDGIILKADTLGALEAMIKLFGGEAIPIRMAEIGAVDKQDVTEAQNVKDPLRRVVFAFNVHTNADAEELAKDLRIKVFSSNVIYKILEDYKLWRYERKEREQNEKIEKVARPAKVQVLKGCIFRASKPCITGVEVLAGFLKKGAVLVNKEGKTVGKVKEMENEGRHIESAKTKDKVAISMDEPVGGRTINEGDVLMSLLTSDDKKQLKELVEKLSEDEKRLLDEM